MTYDAERVKIGRHPVQIVELDIDYCTLSYGTAPCVAALGTTGFDKCFNTRKTCQDPDNYDPATKVYRFSSEELRVPQNALAAVISSETAMEQAGGDLTATMVNAQGFVDYFWEQISGPGTATIADPTSLNTTVSFSASGTYVLRLTASDDNGITTTDVTIIVASGLPAGGTVFNNVSLPAAHYSFIVYLNSVWLAPRGDQAVMSRSTDGGATWSLITPTGGVAFVGFPIGCASDTYFICINDNTNIKRSLDGLTWVDVTAPITGSNYSAMAASGLGVVAVGQLGNNMHSADGGATWANGSGLSALSYGSVAAIDSLTFLAAARNGAGSLAVTANGGTTWTEFTIAGFAVGERPRAVAYDSVNDIVIVTTDAGKAWTSAPSSTALGFSWLSYTMPIIGTALIAAQGRIVAASFNDDATPAAYSDDAGHTWTAVTGTMAQDYWSHFAFGDEIFIALQNQQTATPRLARSVA